MRFRQSEEEILVRDTLARVLSDRWDRSQRKAETKLETLGGSAHAELAGLGIFGAWLPKVPGGPLDDVRMLMELAGQLGGHQFPST